MTSFIIGLLKGILALDSLLLVILVLMQPSKKEAGMGAAFGGGTTDLLLGAGTGNALTAITKWCAGIFLILCLGLSILTTNEVKSRPRNIQDELKKSGTTAVTPSMPPTFPKSGATPPAAPPANASFLTPMSNTTVTLGTNLVVSNSAPSVTPAGSTVVTNGNKRITITPNQPPPATNATAPGKK